MPEIKGDQLLEEVQITGGFGTTAIEDEVMLLRERFVHASGWNPGHTVLSQTVEGFSDSDLYDMNKDTLHISARAGGVLVSCMRITPCTDTSSLSGSMMEGTEFRQEGTTGGRFGPVHDITRLVTCYEAGQRGVDIDPRAADISTSIIAAEMMFGAVAGIQSAGRKIGTQDLDFFDGGNPDSEYSWIFTIDKQVKFLLESSGICVETIKRGVINGDSDETIFGRVRPYRSMQNIIEEGSKVPLIGLPTRAVLKAGYASYIENENKNRTNSPEIIGNVA